MDFYKLTDTKSHYEFENKLRSLLTDGDGRIRFYDALRAAGADENKDLFIDYFQQYAAERKTNKQDYTPQAVADLLAYFSQADDTKAVYDGAAGTGALLVAKWATLKDKTDVTYYATEYADNAMPYLLHNLAYRNVNAEARQGDTITQEIKHTWTLKRSDGGYSEIEIQT